MSSHFLSINRGVSGSKYSDWTSGTASAANVGIELSLDDGARYSKLDVIKALDAMKTYFENPQLVGPSGFVVSG